MKKILLILMLCPVLSNAQKTLPGFENDTLYTSGGYKIYKGQILHVGSGTSAAGYFRFLKFQSGMLRTDTYILQNSTIIVNKLTKYKYSNPEDNSIRIYGKATLKDGKETDVDILLNFERATENYDGLASELDVPEEFKAKQNQTVSAATKKQILPVETKVQAVPDDLKKLLIADEIKKLFDLYKAGALTKEEYETQKNKLLNQ